MKKMHLIAAGVLLSASTAVSAGPFSPGSNNLVARLIVVGGNVLNPILAVPGGIIGSAVAASSGPTFGFIGSLTVAPVQTLLAPVRSGNGLNPLPGLR